MAPHGEAILSTTTTINNSNHHTKSMISLMSSSNNNNNNNNNLQRTVSDISFELMSHKNDKVVAASLASTLPPISEVEDAKCECCGMSEECTPEYIERIRSKFLGKWICGLCSEAVKEEMAKKKSDNLGNKLGLEEALAAHMSACARFNKFGRAFPVLSQAEAMRDLLKRSAARRTKSFSPTSSSGAQKVGGGGLARSSSCIPAITRNFHGDYHRDNNLN